MFINNYYDLKNKEINNFRLLKENFSESEAIFFKGLKPLNFEFIEAVNKVCKGVDSQKVEKLIEKISKLREKLLSTYRELKEMSEKIIVACEGFISARKEIENYESKKNPNQLVERKKMENIVEKRKICGRGIISRLKLIEKEADMEYQKTKKILEKWNNFWKKF